MKQHGIAYATSLVLLFLSLCCAMGDTRDAFEGFDLLIREEQVRSIH